jgi:hypothetical protein
MSETNYKIQNYLRVIQSLASYFGKELNDEALELYYKEVDWIPLSDLREVIEEYKSNRENIFFPRPCDIIRIGHFQKYKIEESKSFNCPKCKGTGFVFVKYAGDLTDTALRCRCEKGQSLSSYIKTIEY